MTWLRTYLAILGALWLTGCGAPSGSGPDNSTPPSPALWEITAPDGQTGWLFGTIHALEDGTTWRTPALDEAFGEAGVLVLEIDDLDDRSGLARTFSRLATTPGQPPLSARVGPDYAAAVTRMAGEAGYSDDAFADMETWAVAISLSRETAPSGEGIDRQLLRMRGDRQLVGLERSGDQLAAFDGLSEEDQVALLVSVAEDTEQPNARARRAASWRSGDLAFLEQETHEGMLRDPDLREALLEGRNRRWLPRVEALVESGRKPFVAVGAAHLVSEIGLPVLLRREGYTVRRIQ